MRINTNVSALRAHGNLTRVNEDISKSMAKLSSGFRITRAADDAAGLGIANVLRADIRALGQAARNSEQANSVLGIAEGATGTIQKMLERMKELAAQAASDSVDSAGRSRITTEYQALRNEIDRTVATVKFQGNTLLNGAFGATINSSSTALGTTTGVYDISERAFVTTPSPSMDILISSNLERLLFELYGRDGAGVAELMDAFRADGSEAIGTEREGPRP